MNEALTKAKEALEKMGSLIRHQYTGSSEAMTALQEADNLAHEALSALSSMEQEPMAATRNVIERHIYKGSGEYQAYLSARFKDRTSNSFEYDGHRWKYEVTSFDDKGDYDIIFRFGDPIAPVAAQEVAYKHGSVNQWLLSLEEGECEHVNSIGKWSLAEKVWTAARLAHPCASKDAERLDFVEQNCLLCLDSLTGKAGGNGQMMVAATRENIDSALAQNGGGNV